MRGILAALIACGFLFCSATVAAEPTPKTAEVDCSHARWVDPGKDCDHIAGMGLKYEIACAHLAMRINNACGYTTISGPEEPSPVVAKVAAATSP